MKKNILYFLALFCSINLLPYFHCIHSMQQEITNNSTPRSVDYRGEINFYKNTKKFESFDEAVTGLFPNLQCFCGHYGENKDDFRAHMKLHYDNGFGEETLNSLVGLQNFLKDESGLCCNVPGCFYKLKRPTTNLDQRLKYHKLKEHLKLKPYTCSQCPFKSHARRQFYQHNRIQHSNLARLIIKIEQPFPIGQIPAAEDIDLSFIEALMNSADLIKSNQNPKNNEIVVSRNSEISNVNLDESNVICANQGTAQETEINKKASFSPDISNFSNFWSSVRGSRRDNLQSESIEKNRSDLNDTSMTTKVLPCQVCTKKLKSWQDWKNHMIERHPEKKPYKCRENDAAGACCTFDTNNQDELVKHINEKHPRSRTLNCLFCSNYSFDTEAFLNLHIKKKHMVDESAIAEEEEISDSNLEDENQAMDVDNSTTVNQTDIETNQDFVLIQPEQPLELTKSVVGAPNVEIKSPNTNNRPIRQGESHSLSKKRKAEEIEKVQQISSSKKSKIDINEKTGARTAEASNEPEKSVNKDPVLESINMLNQLNENQIVELEAIQTVLKLIKSDLKKIITFQALRKFNLKNNIEFSKESKALLVTSLLQLLIKLLTKDNTILAEQWKGALNILKKINELFTLLDQIRNFEPEKSGDCPGVDNSLQQINALQSSLNDNQIEIKDILDWIKAYLNMCIANQKLQTVWKQKLTQEIELSALSKESVISLLLALAIKVLSINAPAEENIALNNLNDIYNLLTQIIDLNK